MPTTAAESMVRKTPKVQAAPEVANKPPQPPVSQENGEQFARPGAENAGIPRVDSAANERISRHAAASGGELIAPPGEDSNLVSRTLVPQAQLTRRHLATQVPGRQARHPRRNFRRMRPPDGRGARRVQEAESDRIELVCEEQSTFNRSIKGVKRRRTFRS